MCRPMSDISEPLLFRMCMQAINKPLLSHFCVPLFKSLLWTIVLTIVMNHCCEPLWTLVLSHCLSHCLFIIAMGHCEPLLSAIAVIFDVNHCCGPWQLTINATQFCEPLLLAIAVEHCEQFVWAIGLDYYCGRTIAVSHYCEPFMRPIAVEHCEQFVWAIALESLLWTYHCCQSLLWAVHATYSYGALWTVCVSHCSGVITVDVPLLSVITVSRACDLFLWSTVNSLCEPLLWSHYCGRTIAVSHYCEPCMRPIPMEHCEQFVWAIALESLLWTYHCCQSLLWAVHATYCCEPLL